MIPLDFVPGTHGHFLEYVLNRLLNILDDYQDPFTALGTSHAQSTAYRRAREIYCGHWYRSNIYALEHSDRVIRITFEPEDVLLVTSMSLLRAADLQIDNNTLHIETAQKLQNQFYMEFLENIYRAYPNIHRTPDIPRHILREYFKFGFRDFALNGYWQELQRLLAVKVNDCFEFDIKTIYDHDRLLDRLGVLQRWLDRPLDLANNWLPEAHAKFLSKVPYLNSKDQCDQIVDAVVGRQSAPIPALTLLQESYINGRLEHLFGREMPFDQTDYFTNTESMLHYLDTEAPLLDDTN